MKEVEKVIYHCYGGAHSSVVSAAIHLGLLRRDRLPSKENLLEIPSFDQSEAKDRGQLLFYGRDYRGVEVYAIGMGGGSRVLKRTLYSFFREEGILEDRLLLVHTLSQVNLCTRVGGFLSRGLGWVSLGRPLVIRGILTSYGRFVDLVEEVEERIHGEVLDGGGQI